MEPAKSGHKLVGTAVQGRAFLFLCHWDGLMRRLLLVGTALLVATLPAAAFTKSEIKQLETLSGNTRLTQACVLEALLKVAADKKGMRPEHVVVDVMGPPHYDGNTLTIDGGAIRSRDKWYGLSFTCVTSADHLQVTAFDYKLGEAIPKEQWTDLNLYQ